MTNHKNYNFKNNVAKITCNLKANKTKGISSKYCATHITSMMNTFLGGHTLHHLLKLS